MHRALIIRIKINMSIIRGVWLKFNENAVVLVSKKKIPLSNRAYGPVLRNLCMKTPAIGCISRSLV